MATGAPTEIPVVDSDCDFSDDDTHGAGGAAVPNPAGDLAAGQRGSAFYGKESFVELTDKTAS